MTDGLFASAGWDPGWHRIESEDFTLVKRRAAI